MKIFISWSGKQSLGVATALRDWLPYLFQGIDPFVSSEDIRKGKRWPIEISKELEASNLGIICLTPDNLEAPWLLFEAGALSKSIKDASVYTLLVGGMHPSSIEGPLSHFQHTLFEKVDFWKLVKHINESHGPTKQDEARLQKIFDRFWGDLEDAVTKVLKTEAKPEKKRSVEDMLQELLETTNSIAKRLPVNPRDPLGLFPGGEVIEGYDSDGLWNEFLTKLHRISPSTEKLLRDLHASGTVAIGSLSIAMPSRSMKEASQLTHEPNVRALREAMSEMKCGSNCSISIEEEPAEEVVLLEPRRSRKSAK